MEPVSLESNGAFLFGSGDVENPAYLPYEEFRRRFSLGSSATEQTNPKTAGFSQAMQADPRKGLEILWEADQAVFDGLERFIPVIRALAPQLAERLKAGGRIFLVGAGSSGRVAVDLAAKCGTVLQSEQVRACVAGGDAAMARAKEGFEDSDSEGAKCLSPFNVGRGDTVFLISASGSSSFNAGCGHEAANLGANVFYFYNSVTVPERTAQLFNRQNNPVRPLSLDIGAQSIDGSTRLQGAGIAECALGALLGSAALLAKGDAAGGSYAEELIAKLRAGSRIVKDQLAEIGALAKAEAETIKAHGMITFLGDSSSIREVFTDAAELPPTFSTTPIGREGDAGSKDAEFRGYMAGVSDNRAAWNTLIGRKAEGIDALLLAAGAPGLRSFANRPKGTGNLVIGAAKDTAFHSIEPLLFDVAARGGRVAWIGQRVDLPKGAIAVLLEGVPEDSLGIVRTMVLKQTLNLLSNGCMALLGKVHGNRMIDVLPSNYKLVDRAMRLTKTVWEEERGKIPWSGEELYHAMQEINAWKRSESGFGRYSPPAVKMALSLLFLNFKPTLPNFYEAARFLMERQEMLDFLGKYTFCIDGGGSKTLLEVLDAKGRVQLSIQAPASNINTVKEAGVRAAFRELFENKRIGAQELRALLPQSRVIAGMAGVGIDANASTVKRLFSEWGIKPEQLLLMTDAELALRLLQGNGIVLIAGTGSICFAEQNGEKFRVGGLGRILGDEGSGYKIGLEAIRAALADEYGYGPPTRLAGMLKAHFQVQELKTLIPKINSLDMDAAIIAAVSPLAFDAAAQGDAEARRIVANAANELKELVSTALRISKLSDCELHLHGGLFKGKSSEMIVDALRAALQGRRIEVVNKANENAAAVFAQMFP